MLNRRNWIKALGGAGATLICGGLKGALECGPQMPPYGVQACIAGIPQEKLNMIFAYQQASEWCWAACIQMVFGFYGHAISQQDIVKQTWGVIANMPAQPQDILRDLNRKWRDSEGEAFSVKGDVFSATGATAAQDLASEMPLIVCSMGHAMVLTAISYNRALNSQGQVTGALVRDPWPGNGGKRELSPMEAAQTMMLVRVRVT